MRHNAATLLFTVLSGTSLAQASEQASVWPTAGWPTSTPEAQGMSPSALADLVEFGAANAIDSVLVVRHGRVVLDAYYAPFRHGLKHAVNSVTKGVVGTLAGIAFKEGALGPLDASVLAFFPTRNAGEPDERKQAMTLASLLDSNSGLSWQEPLNDDVPDSMLKMERSANWIDFILQRPMAQPPGVSFNYDSGTWHLVSAIVAKQTGIDTFEYAKQKLFARLGVTDVAWRRDPQGIPIGGYGLFLQPSDIAKIGYMYLHGGEWAGEQLLPPEWIAKVFHPQVDMHVGNYRYANGWWTIPDQRATMAVGFLRQLIIVLPDIDTVVAATGSGSYPFRQLIDRVRAAVKSSDPLPIDAKGDTQLADRIAEAATEKPSRVQEASSLAKTVSGKTYRFGPNAADLKSLKLNLTATIPSYEVVFGAVGPRRSASRIESPIGLDGMFRFREEAGLASLHAVKGSWLSDNVFEIVSRSVLEGVVTRSILTFTGRRVDIAVELNSGFRARLHGETDE